MMDKAVADDMVQHPAHYTRGGIECLDFILAWDMDFLTGNIVKYVVRAPYKGSQVEDLKKAQFYLGKLIERAERKTQ